MEHEEPEVAVEAPDDATTAEPAPKKAKVAGAEGPGMKIDRVNYRKNRDPSIIRSYTHKHTYIHSRVRRTRW